MGLGFGCPLTPQGGEVMRIGCESPPSLNE